MLNYLFVRTSLRYIQAVQYKNAHKLIQPKVEFLSQFVSNYLRNKGSSSVGKVFFFSLFSFSGNLSQTIIKFTDFGIVPMMVFKLSSQQILQNFKSKVRNKEVFK